MATGDRNGDIAAYDAYCDNIHGEQREDEDLYYATLSNPMRDDEIEQILAQATKDEDFDLVDACETALKLIVQPNLKRQALERISAAVNGAKRVSTSYIAEQRALGWPDIHPEDYCHRCGVAFEPWFTDRETWLVGTAAWSAKTGREGICCVTCFAAMYRAATGTSPTWRLSL